MKGWRWTGLFGFLDAQKLLRKTTLESRNRSKCLKAVEKLNDQETLAWIGMLEGDMDRGYVSVGNGIGHIHEIKNSKAILDEQTRDCIA